MPPLVIPNGVLVRLIYTLGGTPFAVNVLGARKSGALVVNQDLANSVGATIKGSYTSTLGPASTNNVSLANVGVRDISGPNHAEFLDAGAAVAGSVTANSLPPQIAYCVTLRTALAGKSFRGRVYVPGWHTGQVDPVGSAATAVRDAAVGFINDIKTDLPATGLTLAVLSRKNFTSELVTLVQGRDLTYDTIRGRASPGI